MSVVMGCVSVVRVYVSVVSGCVSLVRVYVAVIIIIDYS